MKNLIICCFLLLGTLVCKSQEITDPYFKINEEIKQALQDKKLQSQNYKFSLIHDFEDVSEDEDDSDLSTTTQIQYYKITGISDGKFIGVFVRAEDYETKTTIGQEGIHFFIPIDFNNDGLSYALASSYLEEILRERADSEFTIRVYFTMMQIITKYASITASK